MSLHIRVCLNPQRQFLPQHTAEKQWAKGDFTRDMNHQLITFRTSYAKKRMIHHCF